MVLNNGTVCDQEDGCLPIPLRWGCCIRVPPATAAREQVLLKLFANLGRPVPEASRLHYLALSDDAFAWAFRKRWRGIAPPLALGGVNSSPLAQNPKQGMRLFQ